MVLVKSGLKWVPVFVTKASWRWKSLNQEQNNSKRQSETDFHLLAEKAIGGDSLAVEQLVDRWRNYLLLIANEDLEQELHPKIAPSDIVQQSLVDVQRNINGFRGTSEAEFKAWAQDRTQQYSHGDENTKRRENANWVEKPVSTTRATRPRL